MSKGIPIILAIVLAVISYHFFTGWFNIIPWTIFALLTGYFSSDKKNAIFNGTLFGFFYSLYTYLLVIKAIQTARVLLEYFYSPWHLV
jgi:uncharacterized membrane protein (UPF0136 family)